MDHYLDVRLRPDPEFPATQLLDALFAKLHRALTRLGTSGIGISFPGAPSGKRGLGTCMRVHGRAQSLDQLMSQAWLEGMREHVTVTLVMAAPETTQWATVRRVQAKSSPERLRRRQMKRKGWTAEQAKEAIPDTAAESLTLPYLTVRSLSTGQTFHLFVEQRTTATPQEGSFNAYGLSPTATLPWF